MSRLSLRRVSTSRTAHTLHSFLPIVLCCCAAVGSLAGCAAPGEPIERKPPVAEAINDLQAKQTGNSVLLTFTLPRETVDRRPLNEPLSIEIYRDFGEIYRSAVQPNLAQSVTPATLLVTIPPTMVPAYMVQGRFQYEDSSLPTDAYGKEAVYAVRTRASQKKASANSNIITFQIHLLPNPIDDLKANLTHFGVELTWTTPTKTPTSFPAPRIVAYRIYRGNSTAEHNTEAPLQQIADVSVTDYLDQQIQFGSSYVYSVRSVVENMDTGGRLESADSNLVNILAKDVFPPAAPAGLIVVFVPSQGGEPAHLELSWNISPETDLAGYYVYRSEQSNAPGTRINSEPLPTPAFRDMNAVPGRVYFYRVTAVDQSSNESAASESVSGQVPAASGANPQ